MQAGHDLHHFNFITDLKSFDHLEFSGVVPRTFCGSIVVTLISLPLHLVNDIVVSNLNLTTANIASFIYRATLGVILWSSFCVFRKSLHMSKKFSPRTSLIFSTLLAMQFHIPFYASRSLPNTFALALVMVAYGFWFRNQPTKCLYCIGVASVLFRCDMLVLLAPMALQMLLCEPQQVPFRSTLFTGVGVCVITIIASCLIDSYFWSRPLWPEGEVLLFNTVENKSSEWGTHSWHWYFSSAMPKAMHTCTPLLFLGVLNPYNNSRDERAALWYFLAPVICFLGLYSFLPHKELRFVFPAIPLLTLAAARGMDSLLPAKWFNGGEETGVTGNSAVSDKETDNDTDTAQKSTVGKEETFYCRFHRVTAVLFLLGFVAVTLCTTGVFSIAAQYNYPGGEALLQLNSHLMKADKVSGGLQSNSDTAAEKYAVSETEIETESGGECTAERIVSIHIDAAAAMSGINRSVTCGKKHVMTTMFCPHGFLHVFVCVAGLASCIIHKFSTPKTRAMTCCLSSLIGCLLATPGVCECVINAVVGM